MEKRLRQPDRALLSSVMRGKRAVLRANATELANSLCHSRDDDEEVSRVRVCVYVYARVYVCILRTLEIIKSTEFDQTSARRFLPRGTLFSRRGYTL